MQNLRTTFRGALGALGLALVAGAVSAAPPGTHTTSGQPTFLTGSDTLNKVMDTIFNGNAAAGIPSALTDGTLSNAADGILVYNGTGSGNGENSMTGSTSVAGTAALPSCLVGGVADPDGAPDTNPGCQEIAPMSRPMQTAICDDEESAGKAEGLAICVDGIVVTTNNTGAQQITEGACAPVTTTPNNDTDADGFPEFPDRASGHLRFSGDILSDTGTPLYTVSGWKDVLRLVYTGCKGTDDCLAQPARVARCSDPVRKALVDHWTNLFQGTDCGTGACTQLRSAYRRDDSSGTTAVFLEVLGVKLPLVSSASGASNGQRKSIVRGPGGGTLVAIPDNFPYCDGGQLEAYQPAPSDPSAGVTSDPIHRTCSTAPGNTDIASADDLCDADGTLPLVRPIRTPPASGGFPTVQCTKGNFAKVCSSAWISSKPICPDGTAPSAGCCRLPFFAVDRNGDGDKTDVGDRNFDCMNSSTSRDPKHTTVDGRVYNFVKRDIDGNVATLALDTAAPPIVDVAQWRQNMMNFNLALAGATGGNIPAASQLCQQVDSTQLQGCLVAKSPCTFGWGGREQASTDPFDDDQEPVALNGFSPSNAHINAGEYPFSRNLYVNALGGYENISLDCVDRGGSAHWCNDQYKLSLEFYNMTPRVKTACTIAGFIPLAESVCQGSNFTDGAIPGAGCGAPKAQAHTACLPGAPL
jgi:ABC-type phosphate transport system substrate-binding protein